jgi:tRNA A-37 threonylcarbamoyl transferase component Bud32
MGLEDWQAASAPARRGGQGEVRKVRHIADGREGALKQLHSEEAAQKERRYRFLTEVSGLRAMNGNGLPAVLDANEQAWLDKAADLYLVMEFIEGPTLGKFVGQSRPSLDQAIACTARILEILAAGHALPLHHRDLKPDNVIIRRGDWTDPVLVDLGIAWHGASDTDYATPVGKELGNRFLRLPEFAPGGDHYDHRSDVAMAGGLLFFMLSGKAPRFLLDHESRHPHQAEPSPLPQNVTADLRWPALSRILTVCFQQNIAGRFRDAVEMRTRLLALNEAPVAHLDDLDREMAHLHDLTSTTLALQRQEAGVGMTAASAALYAELTALWMKAGLMHGGQGPTFKDGGAAKAFYCLVSRHGLPKPYVLFRHRIAFSDGRFAASWHLGESAGGQYYEGPAADPEALTTTCTRLARNLAGITIRALNARLASG